MKIEIYDTYEQMSAAAAGYTAQMLREKPDCRLGLTAGKTPVGMFAELVKLYRAGELSFKDAWLYNLEEACGLPAGAPGTCRSYFHEHLMDAAGIADERLVLPDGMNPDLAGECAKYEAVLCALPGGRLDVQILGIGADAHIGMNRPAPELSLDVSLKLSGDGAQYIAMGVGSILLARHILLIANGADKAQAVADMFSRELSTAVPATLLRLHPDVTVMLDSAAASRL